MKKLILIIAILFLTVVPIAANIVTDMIILFTPFPAAVIPTTYQQYRVSDGIGGWENYRVSDGAGGWENYMVAE